MRTIRRMITLVLIMAGLGLLVWACIPLKRQMLVKTILPAEMQAPAGSQGSGEAVLQARRAVVEWPESLRIGDRTMISLAFEPVQNQTSANNRTNGLKDAYTSYNLMAEGRLEVAGLSVNPANPVRESLLTGQTVKLKWTIGALETGKYLGNVWLWLRFLPLDGSSASEVPIFVQEVDIRATSMLGLGGPQARLLGGMGIIAGLGLSYDVMIRMFRKLSTKETKELIG
jgi:hypothetical protein